MSRMSKSEMNGNLKKIEAYPSFRKDTKKLSKELLRRLDNVIEQLRIEPFPSGCRKVRPYKNIFRIRIGDWRLFYEIQGDTLILVAFRHRSRAYR